MVIEAIKVAETEETIEMAAEIDRTPTNPRKLVVIRMMVTMLAREEMLVETEETEVVLSK